MSKLFSRSKYKLKSALYDLQNVASDDSALDSACFNLQQSLEFALKYIFECEGYVYPWGHSISKIISALESYIDIPGSVSVFKDKAGIYTAWESESRYTDSFIGSIKDANECVNRLRDLHEYIETTYHKTSDVSNEAIEWCKTNAPDALRSLPVEELLEHMLPIYEIYKDK